MPLAVIVVNDHAAINGGQAKVAIQSAVGLQKAGHAVTFFAGTGPVARELTDAGIRVVCLDQADIASDTSVLRAAMNGVWNQYAARRLEALLGEFDPANTVVHVHGFAKLLSGSIGAVLARSPVRSVVTMHEYALACPNSGFFHFPDNEICTRKALGVSCLTTNCDSRRAAHKAWRVVRQLAVNYPGRLPSALKDVIYISETQRRVMSPYVTKAELHHLSNPIEVMQRDRVTVSGNDVFLLIGRLSREKGCTLFAEAAREAGVTAVFVGDGDEREAILKANPEAIVTGWQTPQQVVEWIDRARAVVFSSLWYECQPLVPLEALARGVPVIAGRWGAASETVTDGVNGIHLATPSVTELAGVLRSFSREQADLMGRTGYEGFWTSPPTLERHVSGLQSIYEKVMRRPVH